MNIFSSLDSRKKKHTHTSTHKYEYDFVHTLKRKVPISTLNNTNDSHNGRAVWGVSLDRMVIGIVGSNPPRGMDVCPRISVLCCPV
jgi:hypothetical protein